MKNEDDLKAYTDTVAAKLPSTVIIEVNAQLIAELGEDAAAQIINSRIKPFLDGAYWFVTPDQIPECESKLPDISEGIEIFTKILLGEKPKEETSDETEEEQPGVSDPVIEEPKIEPDKPVWPETPTEPDEPVWPDTPTEPTPDANDTTLPPPTIADIERQVQEDLERLLEEIGSMVGIGRRNVYSPDDLPSEDEFDPTPVGQKVYSNFEQAEYTKLKDQNAVSTTLKSFQSKKPTQSNFTPSLVKNYFKNDITIIGAVGLVGGPTSLSVTTIPKVVDMNSTVVGVDSRDYGYAENVMTKIGRAHV